MSRCTDGKAMLIKLHGISSSEAGEAFLGEEELVGGEIELPGINVGIGEIGVAGEIGDEIVTEADLYVNATGVERIVAKPESSSSSARRKALKAARPQGLTMNSWPRPISEMPCRVPAWVILLAPKTRRQADQRPPSFLRRIKRLTLVTQQLRGRRLQVRPGQRWLDRRQRALFEPQSQGLRNWRN